jgi:hypothetical protein
MTAISGWIDSWRPDLLLVDVSVEVAILAHLRRPLRARGNGAQLI